MNQLIESFPFSSSVNKTHVLSPIAELSEIEQAELFTRLSDPIVLKYLNNVALNSAKEIVLTPALELHKPEVQLYNAYLRGTLSPIYTILEAIREHQEKLIKKGIIK